MQKTANPLGLDLIDATGYTTGQDSLSSERVAEIAASMTANGWQGAPLVVVPDYALAIDGTHRLAAAEQAGISVPAVSLEDLFAACDMDLWELLEEHDLSLPDDREQISALLPAETRTAYAIDL